MSHKTPACASSSHTATGLAETLARKTSIRLPESGFVRQVQVLAFIPISKSTLWRRVQAGTFPKPLKLSERVTVWRAEDIGRWILIQGQGD